MKDRDAIELEKESTCEITVKSGRRVENRGEIEGQTLSFISSSSSSSSSDSAI